jgi:hypothetical protein
MRNHGPDRIGFLDRHEIERSFRQLVEPVVWRASTGRNAK